MQTNGTRAETSGTIKDVLEDITYDGIDLKTLNIVDVESKTCKQILTFYSQKLTFCSLLSFFSCSALNSGALSLSFSHLSYCVPEGHRIVRSLSHFKKKMYSFITSCRNGRCDCKDDPNQRKERSNILADVSGYVQAGTMLAIMGPSGSGKTTLIDILAGRNKRGHASGTVLVGGTEPTSEFYKRNTAYVMQDDVFLGNLVIYCCNQ